MTPGERLRTVETLDPFALPFCILNLCRMILCIESLWFVNGLEDTVCILNHGDALPEFVEVSHSYIFTYPSFIFNMLVRIIFFPLLEPAGGISLSMYGMSSYMMF